MDNPKRIKAILEKLGELNLKIHVKLNNGDPFALAFSIPIKPFIYLSGNLDRLDDEALKRIIAHELVHIHKYDFVKVWILPIFLGFGIELLISSLGILSSIFLKILFGFVLIAVLILYFFIISRFVEKRADLLAADNVGKPVLIHSLNTLKQIGVTSTFPHGSLESRIKRL
jgi:Zn-dependent protease with chaperone function